LRTHDAAGKPGDPRYDWVNRIAVRGQRRAQAGQVRRVSLFALE